VYCLVLGKNGTGENGTFGQVEKNGPYKKWTSEKHEK